MTTLKILNFYFNEISIQIWLTADDQLVIMHGGDNGELPKQPNQESSETKYIFDCTFAEIQENHRKTHYFLETSREKNCLIP